MPEKKYSIILPLRTGGEYVKECVSSILAQTMVEFDLVILIHDCNDGTLEWLSTLKDERIIVYNENGIDGIIGNWNRIKTVARNEFMTIIGYDDKFHPAYLATMDALIKQHPRASLYQAHFKYIDSNGNDIRKCQPMAESETAPELLQHFLLNKIDIMATGFIMRSKDYDAIGGIPGYPNLLFADLELWYRLTAISYKATSTEECFSFRLHQSTTKSSSDEKYLAAYERMILFLEQLKKAGGASAKVIDENGITFIQHYCSSLSHRVLRTPQTLRKGLSVAEIIKRSKKYADLLVPGNNYDPNADAKVRMAKFIDSNPVSRKLFLLFKKIWSKPIYS